MEKNDRNPGTNHPTNPTHPTHQEDNTKRKGGEEDRERDTLKTTERDNDGRRNEDTKRPREDDDRKSL